MHLCRCWEFINSIYPVIFKQAAQSAACFFVSTGNYIHLLEEADQVC